MLTPEDIEFIRQTREELVANRQSQITIVYEDGGEVDPITDEVIGGEEQLRPTYGVVTEISSPVKFDRYSANGVYVEKGDIWFIVALEEIVDIYDKITKATYDGKSYEVLSRDKKGIGTRNRAEFVGRLIT